MFVYAVLLEIAYEGDALMGVFSDYVKAREFQLAKCQNGETIFLLEDIVIRKVELDHIYSDCFSGIGEEV